MLAISAASNNVRWDRAVVNARRLHEAVRRAERTLGITAIDRDRYCDKSVFRKWRDLLYAGVLTRQHVDELCYEVLKHAQSNTFTKWPGAYVNARSAQITRAAGGHWTKPKE